MSEAMALERMTQILAELRGYLTATRVPYLAHYEKSGAEKTGTQQGDLDLVGMGPPPDRRLLVAECKGFGGPESYENWLTASYLPYLQYLVWNVSKNIQAVSHVRWGPEFQAKNNRPDEVWIIFSGFFVPASNPARWSLPDKPNNKPFVEKMREFAQSAWNSRDDEKKDEQEGYLLSTAEEFLGKRYDIRVQLYPIHRLLYELFQEVPKDMTRRRKRYADTAMEMLRWISRTVRSGNLDLARIQEYLREETL
jgi:hypothetical protein